MLYIKEPRLQEYHQQIIDCFLDNNIPFDAEYDDQSGTEFNSVVHYTLEFNQIPRCGFIGVNNGKFFGVISKVESIRHLQKEGFEDDRIFDKEAIFASAPCVMAFVCMLALPKIKDLQFSDALVSEFERVVSGK
jgi:hypothetical protein